MHCMTDKSHKMSHSLIENEISSLHGPAAISHQERLYLSDAKDNNTRETLDGDPQGDGGTADEGRDSNKMKKNGESVYVRERERERKGESDRVMEEILLKTQDQNITACIYSHLFTMTSPCPTGFLPSDKVLHISDFDFKCTYSYASILLN
ncbi:hypothetical protein F2P81_016285 [Scophthalmus maximus]|uniref:Uncharacterized protein n=1 Tax=Scophthalmus maximus TaxID=52904 RepID=A0A6A4SIL2_SCOMX|nr:hypothetical protein F2P81_016285 [Scophthalmus maximus]